MMRRFVIGDIHGCAKALRTLIETIDPSADDELVFVGDYIDRGPDSRNVVDQVLSLSSVCKTVTLRGNHEVMLQGVTLGGLDDAVWLANGGNTTVSSYGGKLSKIPDDHLHFYQNLRPYYETEDSIFVHANYDPALEMSQQDEMMIYWKHLIHPLPAAHVSDKRVFVGHTPQAGGHVLDAGHLVGIDTYCFGNGYLTAYEVSTSEMIQVDKHGHLRKAPMNHLAERFRKAGTVARGIYRRIGAHQGRKPRP